MLRPRRGRRRRSLCRRGSARSSSTVLLLLAQCLARPLVRPVRALAKRGRRREDAPDLAGLRAAALEEALVGLDGVDRDAQPTEQMLLADGEEVLGLRFDDLGDRLLVEVDREFD